MSQLWLALSNAAAEQNRFANRISSTARNKIEQTW
jgi:hypothetical protein